MAYLLGKMLFCLLLASILGAIIGWLLKRYFAKKQYDEQARRFNQERHQYQKKTAQEKPQQELATLESKNNALEKKLVKLNNQLVNFKQNQTKQLDELSRIEEEKKILEEAHQHLSKANDQYEEDLCAMGCLKEQLVSLTEDRDKIQKKISQLSGELSTEKQCTAELTEENRRMKAKAAANPDDLQKIKGIGKANEQALKQQGVTCYAQIAAFTTEDEKKYGNTLGVFSSRIIQEEWVKQAKKLHKEKYGEDL